jgi:hypothetical protein
MPSRYALASAGDYTPDDSKAWAKHYRPRRLRDKIKFRRFDAEMSSKYDSALLMTR